MRILLLTSFLAGLLLATLLGWLFDEDAPRVSPESHAELAGAVEEIRRSLNALLEEPRRVQLVPSSSRAPEVEAAPLERKRAVDSSAGEDTRFEAVLRRLAEIERKLDAAGLGLPGLAEARALNPHPDLQQVEHFIRRYRGTDTFETYLAPQEYRLRNKRQVLEEFGTPNGDPLYRLWFSFDGHGLLNVCYLEDNGLS